MPKKIVRVGMVLHRHLEPELDEQVNRLIRKLGSEEFDVRDKAKEALLRLGGAAFPMLEKAAQNKDIEIANAARALVKALDVRPQLKAVQSKNPSETPRLKQ